MAEQTPAERVKQAIAALYATLGSPREQVINGVRELTFNPSETICVLVRVADLSEGV